MDNTDNSNKNKNTRTPEQREKFRLYQQQYRIKLSQEKKDQLKKDNAQRNKHNYHNDSQYRLNKIKQSVDYNKKIRQVYQNLDPTTINNILTQINQNNNNASKNTLDNTKEIKDNTQNTLDTSKNTKDDTKDDTKDTKLPDIITYNDNNTFTCSICNLTVSNKFYNRHINSQKHINNIK